MKRLFHNRVKSFLERQGYEIRRKSAKVSFSSPAEFDARDREIVDYVLNNSLSMTSPQRLIATVQAARYVVETEVPGDFVECGVWRGGNALAAKLVFERLDPRRRVFLFDTFAGMTAPTDLDVEAGTGQKANIMFQASQADGHNEWCYASLEDVQQNFVTAGVDLTSVRFVKGDVCSTLCEAENLPERIAVLRLDTDWYESTLAELKVLYPRLAERGVLLIDDYGHWEGARRAVDEFFEAQPSTQRMFLIATDYTGRLGIKPTNSRC